MLRVFPLFNNPGFSNRTSVLGGGGGVLKGSLSPRMNLLLYNLFVLKQTNKRQAVLMTVMGNLTLQVHRSFVSTN